MTKQLTASLRAKYGKDLSTEFKVSPELLGGLRIKVGSDVIDGSVRERLHRLEAELIYA
jgi:F-type H+-transporting ATPase subunit delta